MPSNSIYQEKAIPNYWWVFWNKLHSNLPSVIGFYGVLALIVLCFISPWVVPHPIDGSRSGHTLLPPAWSVHGDVSYPLGTDQLGQDIYSCLIMSIPYTFGSALIIAITVALIGSIMGTLAVISHRAFTQIIIHVFDFLLAIPSILIAMVVAIFLGPSLNHLMLAIGLSLLPRFIHVSFQAVDGEIHKDYVIAARLDGASTFNILFYSILPNSLTFLIHNFFTILSIAIIDIVTFNYLGLSSELITTDWGVMIKQASRVMNITIWPLIFPGVAIILTIILVNLLDNGLTKALEIGDE